MMKANEVRAAAVSLGHGANVAAFRAGANAAWSDRWADEYGYQDLEAAERHYSRSHSAVQVNAFLDGWAWSASR